MTSTRLGALGSSGRHRRAAASALVAAVALAASGCGGDDAAEDVGSETDAAGTGCGVSIPGTSEARFCSPVGNRFCVCTTGRCAAIDRSCATSYRYEDGVGECVREDDVAAVIISNDVGDFCPAGADADADAEADVDAGGDADADVPGETPAECGNGVVEPGEECEGTGRTECTTDCGSTGTRTCRDCAWQDCIPYAETCNGEDDDCDGDCDDGFDCCAGTAEPCTTTCGSTGSRPCGDACGWGPCVPPEETCDGEDDDCDGDCDDGFDCCAGTAEPCATACGSTGSRSCAATCAWGACIPPVEICNGIDDDCDGRTDEVADGYACGDGCCNGGETYCSCPSDCTVAVAPPAPPVPIAPLNGERTGAYRASASLRPVFRWEPSASGGCGTATHRIEISDSCSGTGLPLSTCTFPATVYAAASGLGSSFTPAAALAVSTTPPVGRRYYWRIRACDGAAGCSAWTAIRYVDVGRVHADLNGDGRSDLAVGAPRTAVGGLANAGVVHVYLGGAGGLGAAPAVVLSSPSGYAQGRLGSAIATTDLDGDGFDELVAGMPGHTIDASAEGAVVRWTGGAAGVSGSGSRRAAPARQGGAQFGWALAAAGDVDADGHGDVAVGSPYYDDVTLDDAGRVDVLRGSADGLLLSSRTILSPAAQSGARFGQAVAGAGEPARDGFHGVAIGAPLYDLGSTDEGHLFVFGGGPAAMTAAPILSVDSPTGGVRAYFAWSLALLDDLDGDGRPEWAAGMPGHAGGSAGAGAVAIVFGAPPDTPSPRTTIVVHPFARPDARFGAAVGSAFRGAALGSALLVVGAPGHSNPEEFEGAGYLFARNASGLSATAVAFANPADQAVGNFGAAVAAGLDFDGDGWDDVAIGAPGNPSPTGGSGRVYVYYHPGALGAFPTTPARTLDAPTATFDFGIALGGR